jgi:hypothetical protein
MCNGEEIAIVAFNAESMKTRGKGLKTDALRVLAALYCMLPPRHIINKAGRLLQFVTVKLNPNYRG